MTLTVAPVVAKAARYAVENWHYSETMPAPPSACFGVWEDSEYIGVVIFGRGAASHLGTSYKLTAMQVCELTRVALRSHKAPVSQIVSLAVEQLKRTSPGLRLIVSFADPYVGHHGGIYQAMNWLYSGTSLPSTMWRNAAGELLHGRVVSSTGVNRQFGTLKRVTRQDECEKVIVPGKHRYLLPLDRAMRRQLASLVQPYPHPAGEVSMGDTEPTGLGGQVRSLEPAP